MIEKTHTNPDISVIYEDNHLLIVDKPQGLLSQEDHTGDPDVVNLCKKYLKEKYDKSGNIYLGLIHRLDRPVGGIMLLAKTSKAAVRLGRQLKDRTIQKTYWAIVQGNPPSNGVLTHHLVKNRNKNIVQAVSPKNSDAKEAILSFQKLETAGDLHLLAVHLQTGRSHQIRVQLSEEGYPIWGDYKYGFSQPDGRTIALYAVEMVFEHPVKREEMRIKLQPPNEFPWNKFTILFNREYQ